MTSEDACNNVQVKVYSSMLSRIPVECAHSLFAFYPIVLSNVDPFRESGISRVYPLSSSPNSRLHKFPLAPKCASL